MKGRPGFNPWVGKIPWRRERLRTPVFWPAEFHGLYIPWGCKESNRTEQLSLSLKPEMLNVYPVGIDTHFNALWSLPTKATHVAQSVHSLPWRDKACDLGNLSSIYLLLMYSFRYGSLNLVGRLYAFKGKDCLILFLASSGSFTFYSFLKILGCLSPFLSSIHNPRFKSLSQSSNKPLALPACSSIPKLIYSCTIQNNHFFSNISSPTLSWSPCFLFQWETQAVRIFLKYFSNPKATHTLCR